MRKVTLKGLLVRKLRLALTALAIIIGVTFVTGTLVLGDTLHRTFDDLVGNVYSKVSFEIRGVSEFGGNGSSGVDSTTTRRPVPDSIIDAVRGVPGVAAAYGSVTGYAQFVAPDGKVIGGTGRSLGFSYDPYASLSALKLVAGHGPTAANEVAIDKATATKYGFKIGEQVTVLTAGPRERFTITGIVTFGSDDNLAGDSLAAFAMPTAQRLFDSTGKYATINILARSGADDTALKRAIERVLPAGLQVVSGQQVAGEVSSSINTGLSFLNTALLIFALISLFVGAFTIYNTFSITIGQRTRELALLRVIGASRRQLFGSVLIEAAITGLIGALIGLGLGVLAALGLKALMSGFGITLPTSGLVFAPRTPIVAILVGVGVTVVSAIVPARRAIAVPPIAALVPFSAENTDVPRARRLGGVALLAIGAVLVIAGVSSAKIALVGLGAAALFAATLTLLPVIARPVVGLIGRPLAALFGIAGRLGRENSMRSPKRTAQTTAALMIGITLVSTIAVLGASISASTKANIDNAVKADYVLTATGFSDAVLPIIQRTSGVKATTTTYGGQFSFRGSVQTLTAVSTANLTDTVNLDVVQGRGTSALTAGELLVDRTTATNDHLKIGQTVTITLAKTGATRIQIGGVYNTNSLIGSYLVSANYFVDHFASPLPSALLIKASPGAIGLNAHLHKELASYPNIKVQTRAQFLESQVKSVNQLLGLIYVLLALAVIVAVIGIINTLMLSVFERIREIGLLRAVGMQRRQLRRMITAESVVIALLGAVVGIVIGTVLGASLAAALRNSGITTVSVPIGKLILFVVLCALLGIAAARWPARKAAKLDILQAIATE